MKGSNSNQTSDGGAAIVAFGAIFSHGFATGSAQSHVLAIASVETLGCSASAAR